MTTITTNGMIILFVLFFAVFLAGLAIGSFRTRRKAEAIMKAKGWISSAEDSFRQTWKEIRGKF